MFPLPVTSTKNTSAYTIFTFTYDNIWKMNHIKMTLKMTAVAQTFLVCLSVSPPLWQSQVDNKYGFLSAARPVLIWLSVSLPVSSRSVDVFWFADCFLSCQQLGWRWGLRFLRGRPHCWSPVRAPARSLWPPARLHSPLKHTDNTVRSDHAFILNQHIWGWGWPSTVFEFCHVGLMNFTSS